MRRTRHRDSPRPGRTRGGRSPRSTGPKGRRHGTRPRARTRSSRPTARCSGPTARDPRCRIHIPCLQARAHSTHSRLTTSSSHARPSLTTHIHDPHAQQNSRLSIHARNLVTHDSRLPYEGSRLTSHGSTQTLHGGAVCPQPTTANSPFTTHNSPLTTHRSRPTTHYPLTAPIVRPLTRKRCRYMKKMTTGMVTSTAAAMSWPHRTCLNPRNMLMPTGSVRMLSERMKVRA